MTVTATWLAIKEMPRDLWAVLILKLLTCYSIFAVVGVLSVYLNKTHHYNDGEIATIIASFGFISSSMSVITGPLIDRLGYRNSLVIGLLVNTVGTGLLAASLSRYMLFIATMVLLPFGTALSGTSVTIAAKQLSSSANRDVVFAALYAMINVGATLAFFSYDFVRFQIIPEDRQRFYFAYLDSSERVLIGGSALISLCSMIVSRVALRNIIVAPDGHLEPDMQALKTPPEAAMTHWERYVAGPFRYLCSVLRDPMLRRMTLFNTCLMPLSMFYVVSQTAMPNWILRVLGNDAPIGSIMAINGIVVVLFSVPASIFFSSYDKYRMIVFGSLFAAVAIFFFGIEPNAFTLSIGWILFSLGEATYSPRTSPFALVNYPKDHEGAYLTVAGTPATLISLPLTWLMGGKVLELTCPVALAPGDGDGARKCTLIWPITAGVALLTPLLLLLFARYIYSQEVRANVSSQTKHYQLDEATSHSEQREALEVAPPARGIDI